MVGAKGSQCGINQYLNLDFGSFRALRRGHSEDRLASLVREKAKGQEKWGGTVIGIGSELSWDSSEVADDMISKVYRKR